MDNALRVAPELLKHHWHLHNKNGMRQKEKKFCNAEFYEADIQVDSILSYPWLVQNKIGVLTHRRAVVTDSRILCYYTAWVKIRQNISTKVARSPASKLLWKMQLGENRPWRIHRLFSLKGQKEG